MSKTIYKPINSEEEFLQAASLMKNQYGRNWTLDYFQWQYCSEECKSALMGAKCGSELIGILGVQTKQVSNKSLLGQLTDILVKPEYRRRGIFDELFNQALNLFPNCDGYCVFPNLNGKKACEKAGFKTLKKIDLLVLSGKANTIPGRRFAKEDNILSFSYPEEYFNWRFEKNPTHSYRKATFNDGEVITKIYKNPQNNEKCVDIVFFKENGPEFANELMSLINELWKSDIKSVVCWDSIYPDLKNFLVQLGFQNIATERYFCFLSIDNRFDSYDNEWLLHMADTEMY